MTNNLLEKALEKGTALERLNRDEALAVAEIQTPHELHRLGEAALENRRSRFGKKATFVVNQHINPSNICEGECGFCRYSAKEGHANAYQLTEEEILSRIDRVRPVEVHIVGGMNHIWDFKKSLHLIRSIRELSQDMYIKAYTAVEMDWFARNENTTIDTILQAFKQAGLNGMPGGGAELFSKRMRKKFCPTKIGMEQWIGIHHAAHGLGLKTNATMLYGLNESFEERVDHLLTLRNAQDESQGFSCFIPLAYQKGEHETSEYGLFPKDNLAVIGLARLVLDNFSHIKAYWPMIGLETASAGLSFGADDIDGTVGGERIAHAAGAKTPRETTREKMEETIRLGGFIPVERDGNFKDLSSPLEAK